MRATWSTRRSARPMPRSSSRPAPIQARYDAATELIDGTEPQSLPAIIVKLRRLLEAHSALAGYDPERDSVRQRVDFLERQIWGDVRAAPEPEVGFGEPEPRQAPKKEKWRWVPCQ